MQKLKLEDMGKSKHKRKRANGTGTLIKKPNGIYQARWSYDGEFHYQSTGETNYEKALEVLAKIVKPYQEDCKIAVLENIQAQINTGKKKRELEKERNTTIAVADIWTRFLETDKKVRTAKPQTQKVYLQYIRKLVNWLTEQGISDIKMVTEEHARQFKERLLGEMCADSVKQRLNTYRWVWRSLETVAFLKSNPWSGEDGDLYKVKVTESGHRRLLSDGEVENLVANLKDDEERLLFGFGIYLGQRISDCACFKKSYINFETNEVHFKPIKTQDCKDPEVYATLHPSLRALIDKVVDKGGDDDYLMPKFAEMWKKHRLSEYVARIFSKADIKTFKIVEGKRQIVTGFHALRVWWATKARDWMPESVVSKILCHRTEKMSEHYFRQNRETIEKGLNKFKDFFGNGVAPQPDPTDTPDGTDGASVRLPQGVTAEEMKTLVEILNGNKRSGEGLVDYLKRLVAMEMKEVVAMDVESPLLNYKKAS